MPLILNESRRYMTVFSVFLESALTSARFAATTLLIGFWYDGSFLPPSMSLPKVSRRRKTDEVSLLPRADLCGAAMNPHVSTRTKFWSTIISFIGLAAFAAIILSRISVAALVIYPIAYVAGTIVKLVLLIYVTREYNTPRVPAEGEESRARRKFQHDDLRKFLARVLTRLPPVLYLISL